VKPGRLTQKGEESNVFALRHFSLCTGIFFSLNLFFAATDAAMAGACTPGSSCYCDRVKSGDLKDPSMLMCEDFEAPTLRSSTGVGAGAPYYGPWYDDTGWAGVRGYNSYWNRTYGNGVNSFLWHLGEPASPIYGITCAYSLCRNAAWDAADRWQANSFAGIAIMTDSDFSVEIPTVTAPGGKAGGGSGAFDGAASLASRVPAGRNMGIYGRKNFGGAQRTFGITTAMAFPNNLVASGIITAPWKFNEWVYDPAAAGGDGIFLFHNKSSLIPAFPFENWMNFGAGGGTQASCQAAVNAATKIAGTYTCTTVGLEYHADPGLYNQATDWPLGKWGCARGYFQNMGFTNSSIQIWFTGPAGIEKKIIDIQNFDTSRFNPAKTGGYHALALNNYSNRNQAGTPTSQTTFRYEDNLHIRVGPPVSCAQIGFGPASPSPAPAPAPTADTTPPAVSIASPMNGATIQVR
jgi:hypothetical protein